MKYALWTSLGGSNPCSIHTGTSTRRQMAKPDLKGTAKLNHFQRYFEASGAGCHSLFNTYRDKFLALLFFFTCALLSTGFFFTPSAIAAWGCTSIGTTQVGAPFGVAVDSSGNVYVADTYNHRIQKFNSSGGYLTQWGVYGSGDGQFIYPYGVAVDSSGNVYVSDSVNHRIQKFNSSGGYLTQWGVEGSGNGQFYYPRGVAVDGSGNVYVADTYNNRIQKFNSSGGYLTQWGVYGTGDGQFNYPLGVAVDSSGSGNVYVADSGNDRIQSFDDTCLPTATTCQCPADSTPPMGCISGRVTDLAGNPLANKKVKLKRGTTLVDTTITDVNGCYWFTNLRDGTYKVILKCCKTCTALKQNKTITGGGKVNDVNFQCQ